MRAATAATVRWGILAAVLALAAGCTVGPDFQPPSAPAAGAYTARALPAQTAGGAGGPAQKFVLGADIPAAWWKLFQCKPLDSVMREALQNSPTLAAARAALVQAQGNWRAGFGSVWFPGIDAAASAQRQGTTGAGAGAGGGSTVFSLYNASVSVSYLLDIFGGGRRSLESLRAQVSYQQFQRQGAYLTLTSNIVTTAVQEASLRGQIAATQEIISLERKQLDLVQKQLQVGGASRSDVLAQRAQLAQTQAELPPLEKQLALSRHQLAILAGRLPSEGAALPQFSLADLHLPRQLPVSLPSELVRQRPDVRASEALWHAACAQVGVATANLLPQVTLSGSYSSQAGTAGKLLDDGTHVWDISGGLTQPLFHGGELLARRRAAMAAYHQAAAQYRETVLLAFRNVADALRALEADARTLQAQAAAQKAARAALNLTQQQFQLGAVTYLSLLSAQRQYQQARLGLVQARAARLADTAALFSALGGGWWNATGQGGREAGPDGPSAADNTPVTTAPDN